MASSTALDPAIMTWRLAVILQATLFFLLHTGSCHPATAGEPRSGRTLGGSSLRLTPWPWRPWYSVASRHPLSHSLSHSVSLPTASWKLYSLPLMTHVKSTPMWKQPRPPTAVNRRETNSHYAVVYSLNRPSASTRTNAEMAVHLGWSPSSTSLPLPSPATPWLRMVTGSSPGTPMYDLVETVQSPTRPQFLIHRPAVTRVPFPLTYPRPLTTLPPMVPLGLQESATGAAADTASQGAGSVGGTTTPVWLGPTTVQHVTFGGPSTVTPTGASSPSPTTFQPLVSTDTSTKVTETEEPVMTTNEPSDTSAITTGAIDVHAVTSSVTADQVVTTGVTTDEPVKTGVTTDEPVKTGVTADQVVTTGVTTDEPVKTGVTTDRAVTAGVTADQAVTTGVTTDQAVTTGVTTDQAVTTSVTTDQAVTTGVTTDQAVTTGVTTDQAVTTNVTTDYVHLVVVTTARPVSTTTVSDNIVFGTGDFSHSTFGESVTSLPVNDTVTVQSTSDAPLSVTSEHVVTTVAPVTDIPAHVVTTMPPVTDIPAHVVTTVAPVTDVSATVTSEHVVTTVPPVTETPHTVTSAPDVATEGAVTVTEQPVVTTTDWLDSIEIEVNRRGHVTAPETTTSIATDAVNTWSEGTAWTTPDTLAEAWSTAGMTAETGTFTGSTESTSDFIGTSTTAVPTEAFPTTLAEAGSSTSAATEVFSTSSAPTEESVVISTIWPTTAESYATSGENFPTTSDELASISPLKTSALATTETPPSTVDDLVPTSTTEAYTTLGVDPYTAETYRTTAAALEVYSTTEDVTTPVPKAEAVFTTPLPEISSTPADVSTTLGSDEATTTSATTEFYSNVTKTEPPTTGPIWSSQAYTTASPPQSFTVVTRPLPAPTPTSGPVQDFNYYDGVAFEDGLSMGGSPADGYIPDYDDRADEYDGDYFADAAARPRLTLRPPALSDTKGLEIASLVRETPAPEPAPAPPRRSDVLPEDDDEVANMDDIFSNDVNFGAIMKATTATPPTTARYSYRDSFEGQMLRRMVPLVLRQIRMGHLSEEDITRLKYIFGPVWPEVEKLARSSELGRGRRNAAVGRRRERRNAGKYPHFKRWRGVSEALERRSTHNPSRRPAQLRRRPQKHGKGGRKKKRGQGHNGEVRKHPVKEQPRAETEKGVARPKRAAATQVDEYDEDYMGDDSDYYETEDEGEDEDESADGDDEYDEDEDVPSFSHSLDDNPSVMELHYRSRQAQDLVPAEAGLNKAPRPPPVNMDDEDMAMDDVEYEYY